MNESNIKHYKSQLLTLLQTIDDLNKFDNKIQDLFGKNIDDSFLTLQTDRLSSILIHLLGMGKDYEYQDRAYDIILFGKEDVNTKFQQLLEILPSEEGDE